MFPGQFHWHALDQIEGPSFTFSVLRQPVARIASFYFFLRAVAARSDPAKLSGPHMQGIHAALTLPPDAFFCDSGSPEVRTHIDDLFDNFYTFYFAGGFKRKTLPKPKSWPPRNATSICSAASIRPTI